MGPLGAGSHRKHGVPESVRGTQTPGGTLVSGDRVPLELMYPEILSTGPKKLGICECLRPMKGRPFRRRESQKARGPREHRAPENTGMGLL